MTTEIKKRVLPRFDLREPAFRKYEPLIAKACWGSFVHDPRPEQKAVSFRCRFKDAVLAFRRYGYESKVIPLGYDLGVIKVHELEDGTVLVENPREDARANALVGKSFSASDMEGVRELCGKLASRQLVGPVDVFYSGPAELAELNRLMDEYDVSVTAVDEKKVQVR